MVQLKRTVGLVGAASVGIADIVGAEIFVLSGVAAGTAGPSVILSFCIAGIVALMTALSSAELVSYVNEAGASYAFTKRAFGRHWSFQVAALETQLPLLLDHTRLDLRIRFVPTTIITRDGSLYDDVEFGTGE